MSLKAMSTLREGPCLGEIDVPALWEFSVATQLCKPSRISMFPVASKRVLHLQSRALTADLLQGEAGVGGGSGDSAQRALGAPLTMRWYQLSPVAA